MKKTIYILLLLSSVMTKHLNAQACEATFHVYIPQCHLIFDNTSDPSWKYSWNINGKVYYSRSVEFLLDDYESFDAHLYTYDSFNNCRDTVHKVVPGRKKVTFESYVYKQQLYAIANIKGSNKSAFVIDYGDKAFGNSELVGVFKHTYKNPGTYKIALTMGDTIMKGSSSNVCLFFSDTIPVVINSNSQCHSRFVAYNDTSIKDSIWLFNWSAGENLKYYWDLGDGSSSTKRFPDHKYSSAKKVKVCLTIEDTVKKCISTFCDSISVIPGMYLQVIHEFEPGPDTTDVSVENILKTNVSVFPNPFGKNINVRLPELDSEVLWEIISSDGRRMMYGVFPPASVYNPVDLEILQNGLYLMILRHENVSMTLKLIKD